MELFLSLRSHGSKMTKTNWIYNTASNPSIMDPCYTALDRHLTRHSNRPTNYGSLGIILGAAHSGRCIHRLVELLLPWPRAVRPATTAVH